MPAVVVLVLVLPTIVLAVVAILVVAIVCVKRKKSSKAHVVFDTATFLLAS